MKSFWATSGDFYLVTLVQTQLSTIFSAKLFPLNWIEKSIIKKKRPVIARFKNLNTKLSALQCHGFECCDWQAPTESVVSGPLGPLSVKDFRKHVTWVLTFVISNVFVVEQDFILEKILPKDRGHSPQGGRITVWLVTSLSRMDPIEEAVECNLGKLKTFRTNSSPPWVDQFQTRFNTSFNTNIC